MTIILKTFKIAKADRLEINDIISSCKLFNEKEWVLNMGSQLHETKYGQIFFEHQLPALIKAINRLADVGEKKLSVSPVTEINGNNSNNSNKVYVCYEENSPELAIENGAVENICVVLNLEEVGKWIEKQRKAAEAGFYTVSSTEEENNFYNELNAGKEAALVLYHNGDENSRLFYSLIVKPILCSNTFFPNASEKTRERLREVMTDAEKSEKLGEAFVEQVVSDDEKKQRIGYYLAKAILDNSVEDLLIAVCGWTSKSLLNIAEFGTAYSEE